MLFKYFLNIYFVEIETDFLLIIMLYLFNVWNKLFKKFLLVQSSFISVFPADSLYQILLWKTLSLNSVGVSCCSSRSTENYGQSISLKSVCWLRHRPAFVQRCFMNMNQMNSIIKAHASGSTHLMHFGWKKNIYSLTSETMEIKLKKVYTYPSLHILFSLLFREHYLFTMWDSLWKATSCLPNTLKNGENINIYHCKPPHYKCNNFNKSNRGNKKHTHRHKG